MSLGSTCLRLRIHLLVQYFAHEIRLLCVKSNRSSARARSHIHPSIHPHYVRHGHSTTHFIVQWLSVTFSAHRHRGDYSKLHMIYNEYVAVAMFRLALTAATWLNYLFRRFFSSNLRSGKEVNAFVVCIEVCSAIFIHLPQLQLKRNRLNRACVCELCAHI